jgi:hypothetical protein
MNVQISSLLNPLILNMAAVVDAYADIRPPIPELGGGDKGWGAVAIVGIMAIVAVSVILLMAWRRRRS